MKYNKDKDEYSVTMRSPINIALVKYWGKEHEEQIIPCNNSISLTINKNELCSTTTVTLTDDIEGIQINLNGKNVEKISDRISRVVKTIKEIAEK